MTWAAENHQVVWRRFPDAFWIPDVVSVIGNRLLAANLTIAFLSGQRSQPHIFPFVGFEINEAVGVLASDAHFLLAILREKRIRYKRNADYLEIHVAALANRTWPCSETSGG